MFNIEGHVITLITLLKTISLFWIVWYLPFVIFRLFKGGTYSIYALSLFALAMSVFVTLQWLM